MHPAILWLAGTVMGKAGPVTFHEARNTVVGWHRYGRGRARKIFPGARITVDFSSLPRVHEVGHFEIKFGRKRPCTKISTLVFLNEIFKTFQTTCMVT